MKMIKIIVFLLVKNWVRFFLNDNQEKIEV